MDTKSVFRLLTACGLALMIAGQALAGDYYLDATLGDDALNDGSEASPWQSLAKVASVLAAGDTVYLKRGEVWKERLTIPVSGQPGAPLTFTAYGSGAKPVIHGGRTAPGSWSGPVNGVYSIQLDISARPQLFPYFIIEDNKMIPHASGPDCTDGNWYRETGTSFYTAYYKPTSGTFDPNRVELVSTYNGFQIDGKHDIVISDIEFTMLQRAVYGRVVPGTTNAVHDITITNSEFTNTRFGAIFISDEGIGNHHISVTGNTFSNNGFPIAFYAQGNGLETNDYLTVTDNLLLNSGETVDGEFWSEFNNGDQEGIGFQNTSYSVISRNRIINGIGVSASIDLWINSTPGTESVGQFNEFTYNYIENAYGSGIVPGGQGPNSGGHTIAYNVILNSGTGPKSAVWSGVWGALRLNTTQNPPSYVYNNTLVGNDTNIYFGGGASNYVMNNNISYAPADYHIRNYFNIIRPNTMNYNLYHPDGQTLYRVHETEYNFQGWLDAVLAATGETSPDSLIADPAFVAVSGNDFHLTTGSFAIDGGTDVGATADYDGNPIVGAPDIGAYEYQPAADLAVSMTSTPEPVSKNGTLSYDVTVSNPGPDSANGVVVSDVLPAEIDNVTATASQGSCDVVARTETGKGKNKTITPASVTCNLSALDANSNATVVISGTVLGGETLTNTVSVDSSTPDTDSSNNSATIQSTVSSGGGGKPCKGKNC